VEFGRVFHERSAVFTWVFFVLVGGEYWMENFVRNLPKYFRSFDKIAVSGKLSNYQNQ
jgi:hypothetical protein